jgi:hypothetical protein
LQQLLGSLIKGPVNRIVTVFSGGFAPIGPLAPHQPAQASTVMLALWHLCYWLYKHRIFIRV